MNISKYGLVFAVISPFLSSIATIFIGKAIVLTNQLVVLSFSALFGGVILLLILKLRNEQIHFKHVREHLKDFLLLTSTRQIIGMVLFVYGLALTSPIKAIFYTKVEPYFVLFLYWKYKNEPVTIKHIVLLGIHITGAILLSTGGNFTGFDRAYIGDILVIASMGTAAYSYFPASHLAKNLGALQTNTYMLLFAGLVFLPFALFFSDSSVWQFSVGWIYIFLYALIFSVFSLTFWFLSIKTVKPWIVSALRALGPVVGAPFAYFVFGETLSSVQIFGGAIVIATSFLIALEHGKWLGTHKTS